MTDSDGSWFLQGRRVFEEIVSLPEAERAAALDRLVGGDEALRREVGELIAADQRSEDVFDRVGDVGGALERAFQPAGLPDSIGGYRVLGVLGEGGLSVVYRAQQEVPNRDVALKVLHSLSVSEASRARYDFEVETLGRLDHPAIAKIYDAGTDTIAGFERRYLVMELVEGLPITEHAQSASLGVRERLSLFCDVCDAIQYAHQQGVIHRDIKPANVLVSGRKHGVHLPKVLDFGVARSVEPRGGQGSGPTLAGQLVGTLSYMSPEQLSGDSDRIDTRSDVYALGILLYELLANRLPHSIADKSITDAIQILRMIDPIRPRTASRNFGDELEAITLTAMEKDPDRRYASASELAADVRRWLDDKPIVARTPSRAYQLRKFAKRNWVALAAVSCVILMLGSGFAFSALALERESEARKDAVRFADLAAQRESEAQRAVLVSDAKSALLESALRSVTPQSAAGRDVSILREILDDAAEAAEIDLAEFPVERAELLGVLGEVYMSIAAFESAASTLVRAVDAASDPENATLVLDSRRLLARAHHYAGRLDEAEVLIREDLAATRAIGDDRALATHLMFFAEILLARRDDSAINIAREAAEVSARIDDEMLARCAFVLGAVYRANGDFEAASELYRQSERIALEIDDVILRTTAINSLAAIARARGDLLGAEELYRQSVELRVGFDARAHPDTAVMLSNLGRTLFLQEKYNDSLEVLDRAILMHRELYPNGHTNLAIPMVTRGRVLSEIDRYEEAVAQIVEGSVMLRHVVGPLHPYVATSLMDLGNAHLAADQGALSEKAFRQAERVCDEAGIQSVGFRMPLAIGLAGALAAQSQFEDAIGMLNACLAREDITDRVRAHVEGKLAEIVEQRRLSDGQDTGTDLPASGNVPEPSDSDADL